jgi:AraC family transcriptional activator FtrA
MPNTHLPKNNKARTVASIVYDGLCTFEYGIVAEIFGLPRPEYGANWYRFITCACEKGPLRANGGLRVTADYGLEGLKGAGTIIIPGWKGVGIEVPSALKEALLNAYKRGARLVSICSGVFVLAATGLLNGKTATTHWRHAQKLSECYPDVSFNADVLYVDEGRLLTSAGSAAGLDLCLHLVKRDFGADIANQVARRLILPAHRNGGQRQYIERPVPKEKNDCLSDVIDYMRAHLDKSMSVAFMANKARMSLRTFNRRFVETTGETPGRWLIRERVDRARELLEGPHLSIEELVRLSGFETPAALRHHFRQLLKTSPSEYRQKFGRL